jgi:hypothetical protein
MTPDEKRLQQMKKYPGLFAEAIRELTDKLNLNIEAHGSNKTAKKREACRTQEETCKP